MNGHAICPFCERAVLNGGVDFGDHVLHDECYSTLQEIMDKVDPVSLLETPSFLEETHDGSDAA